MSLRLISISTSLALLSSCTAPRTAMIAGTVTAGVGGVLLYQAGQPSGRVDEEGLFNRGELNEAAGAILVIAIGVGIIMGGMIGWGNEREAAARAAGRPSRTTGTGTAMLEARIEQLEVQLGVALRAGRCAEVTALAHRLEALEHPVDATCPRAHPGL